MPPSEEPTLQDLKFALCTLFRGITTLATGPGIARQRLREASEHLFVLQASHLPPSARPIWAKVLDELTSVHPNELEAKDGRSAVDVTTRRMRSKVATELARKIVELHECVAYEIDLRDS